MSVPEPLRSEEEQQCLWVRVPEQQRRNVRWMAPEMVEGLFQSVEALERAERRQALEQEDIQ